MGVLFVFKKFYILFSDHHFAAAADIVMGKINKTMQQKYTDSQLLSMMIQSKQNAAELCKASLKVEQMLFINPYTRLSPSMRMSINDKNKGRKEGGNM